VVANVMTCQMFRVMEALLTNGEMYGAKLAKTCAIPTGSIYPLLASMLNKRFLSVRLEVATHGSLRPLIKYYSLTPMGAEYAKANNADVVAKNRVLGCSNI
jgi:DNA-binding PadR family transcriptional regulator